MVGMGKHSGPGFAQTWQTPPSEIGRDYLHIYALCRIYVVCSKDQKDTAMDGQSCPFESDSLLALELLIILATDGDRKKHFQSIISIW